MNELALARWLAKNKRFLDDRVAPKRNMDLTEEWQAIFNQIRNSTSDGIDVIVRDIGPVFVWKQKEKITISSYFMEAFGIVEQKLYPVLVHDEMFKIRISSSDEIWKSIKAGSLQVNTTVTKKELLSEDESLKVNTNVAKKELLSEDESLKVNTNVTKKEVLSEDEFQLGVLP